MDIEQELRDLFAVLDREIELTHEEDAAQIRAAIERALAAQSKTAERRKTQ